MSTHEHSREVVSSCVPEALQWLGASRPCSRWNCSPDKDLYRISMCIL